MKAAVWHAAGDIRVEHVSGPEAPARGNVIVEIMSACICASDVAEYRDGPHVIPVLNPHPLTGRSAPLTLGHEYAGRIVAVGDEVRGLAVGDRVCGDACLRCGRCFWCARGAYNICALGAAVGLHADGAFAEFLEVPAYTLYMVPDSVSYIEAATAEPLAVGLHALRRARHEPGESVAIFGFGMIGAAVAMLARATGAAAIFVVEPSPNRRRLVTEMALGDAFDSTDQSVGRQIRDMTGGIGADVVVDCSGQGEVLDQAISSARRGGRVAIAGIGHGRASVSTDRLVYFEREVIGSLGYTYDHPTVLNLMADGRIDVKPTLGDPIELDRIRKDGFDRLLTDDEAPLRIPIAIR